MSCAKECRKFIDTAFELLDELKNNPYADFTDSNNPKFLLNYGYYLDSKPSNANRYIRLMKNDVEVGPVVVRTCLRSGGFELGLLLDTYINEIAMFL